MNELLYTARGNALPLKRFDTTRSVNVPPISTPILWRPAARLVGISSETVMPVSTPFDYKH